MHATAHLPAGFFGIAFLRAMRRALPQLLLATIAAGLATYLAQSWITPRYVAEARLTVSGPDRNAAVETHVRGLQDPIRLFSVASELELQRMPGFGEQGRGWELLDRIGFDRVWGGHKLQNADERLLAAVYERFTAAAGDGEGEIVVGFAAADPQVAARFVNRLVELYLASLWPGEAGSSAQGAETIRAAVWAEAPDEPVIPRKGRMAMLAMAVMLLVGLGSIAAREAFRTSTPRSTNGFGSTERYSADLPNAAPAIGKLGSSAAAADRILALPPTDRGCRIMVAGEETDIDAVAEAWALADSLSSSGRRAVLVRWDLGGGDVNGRKPPRGVVGINDLLEGTATFEEIVMRLPGSSAHAIAAGTPVKDRKAALDPDLVGLVLDTLDEVYDYIVVVAEHEEAINLFVTLEGRFDVCVSVGEEGRPAGKSTAAFDRFLGFEVMDIHIIRLERERQAARERVARLALQTRHA